MDVSTLYQTLMAFVRSSGYAGQEATQRFPSQASCGVASWRLGQCIVDFQVHLEHHHSFQCQVWSEISNC